MNIRGKVKYGFIVLIFFIFSIIFINHLSIEAIEENEEFVQKVNKLISLQNQMNFYINTLALEKKLDNLKPLKDKFFEAEEDFEKIEDQLKQSSLSSSNKGIEKDLKELYHSEKEIDEIFEEIYELQNKSILADKRFKELYPNERKTRKLIGKELKKIETMTLVKSFADVKYYGKEALYQYKDQKTFDKWLLKIDILIKELQDYPLEKKALEYKTIITEVASLAIKTKDHELQKEELINKLKLLLEKNKNLSLEIGEDTSKITEDTIESMELIQKILAALVLGFAFFISAHISSKLSSIMNILLKNTTKVKDGDLNLDIKIDDDEFNKIAVSLNEMAKSVKDHQDHLEEKIKERTRELEIAKDAIEDLLKHTQDSIEYASLIQHSIIPEDNLFNQYFEDHFTIWQPKDIVGGDIYLFEQIREGECLLFVIDCTGHGVPGAFVTMLVKAIERQISFRIERGDGSVSPAEILSIFNKSIKHLLKQEDKKSISNAGFDGGIIYFNKNEKIIKYSGAHTSLFYIEDGELKTIKGNRHSVGYKRSDSEYKFKEHTLEVKDGMQFYITSDGFVDQSGGEKGFCLGKTKFKDMLLENKDKNFLDQKDNLLDMLDKYQGDLDRNDDITVVGFKI